jgi:hypothetical protein
VVFSDDAIIRLKRAEWRESYSIEALMLEAKRRLALGNLDAPGGMVGTLEDLTDWGLVAGLLNALELSRGTGT